MKLALHKMWQVHCFLIMKAHCEFQRPPFCDKMKKLFIFHYLLTCRFHFQSLHACCFYLVLGFQPRAANLTILRRYVSLLFLPFLSYLDCLCLLWKSLLFVKRPFYRIVRRLVRNVFFSKLYLASTTLFLILILFSINKLICRILI